jgi:formiminoglutamase
MTMRITLPILISLPHGGLAVPPEVADRLAIDATRIHNECDLWVDQLFGVVADQALAAVAMPTARVLVDANRDPGDLQNPDGAIKTTTSYGEPIYRTPLAPHEQSHLLAKYYRRFHHALSAAIIAHGAAIRLFLDCHNMAQHGPSAYADPGRPRPLLCLANDGDAHGESRPDGQSVTCDPALLRDAAALATELFDDLELLEPDATRPPTVALNRPFAGGYVLRTASLQLAARTGRPLPCLMVEVNRGLFVGRQAPDTPITAPPQDCIADLGDRLARWVAQLVELLPADKTEHPR